MIAMSYSIRNSSSSSSSDDDIEVVWHGVWCPAESQMMTWRRHIHEVGAQWRAIIYAAGG